MSWAVIRIRSPALRTLPSRTVRTFNLSAMLRMSSFFPLNANDDVRDATRRDWIRESALMISSAMPSAKYSFSGSALMFANGRTATDFAADTGVFGIVSVSVGVAVCPETSACANNADVENLFDVSTAIALVTAQSTLAGTEDFRDCSGRGLSVKRFAMIDCGVLPLNGRSPEIIS